MHHAVGESHLLNLCIAPQCQGRGLGGILLEHCFRVAIAAGCDSMFLEVRPSNVAAIELYRRNGFRPVGRRPAYYTAGEGREDALIMRRDL
jgi:ribosomal-protein-alanine N-acetyltransferase